MIIYWVFDLLILHILQINVIIFLLLFDLVVHFSWNIEIAIFVLLLPDYMIKTNSFPVHLKGIILYLYQVIIIIHSCYLFTFATAGDRIREAAQVDVGN